VFATFEAEGSSHHSNLYRPNKSRQPSRDQKGAVIFVFCLFFFVFLPFDAFKAGQPASHCGGTGLPAPVNGMRLHLRDGVDGSSFRNRDFNVVATPEGLQSQSRGPGIESTV
jgi:hypothetical protein